jgi:hypothetical protein
LSIGAKLILHLFVGELIDSGHHSAMAIIVRCSGYGASLRCRDEALGKRAKCPKCGHVVEIRPSLVDMLDMLRAGFDGFNEPASERELSKLQEIAGPMPEEVLTIYRRYNGTPAPLAPPGWRWLSIRLMPIMEALGVCMAIDEGLDYPIPKLGSVIWLWTDDNSNYCGLYLDGPAAGWVTRLDHENQMLTPAFRSLTDFYRALLAAIVNDVDEIHDVNDVPANVPEVRRGSKYLSQDRQLAATFRNLYRAEQNEDQRRLYAFSSMCLTPVEDTQEMLHFLDDPDPYTAGAAVTILEIRRFPGAIDAVERLALTRGDRSALRWLVLLDSKEARQAVARLRQTLDKDGLGYLDLFIKRRDSLPPATWP